MKDGPGRGGEVEGWRALAADIRRAATPLGRARLGRYAIEGTRVHERAVRAEAPLESVLLSRDYRDDPSPRVRRLVAAIEQTGCTIEIAPPEIVGELTAGRALGSIVGMVRLPRPPSLAGVLAKNRERGRLLLVGVEIDDPGNIGALVRTALASGAAAFVALGGADPFHPRAVRTSMGSLLKLPLLRYQAPDKLLGDLDRHGLATVGAVASGGTPLPEAPLAGRDLAVFVGSEAFGLSGALAAELDSWVTVPMADGVDSFSVNAAAAIVLYEARRRSR